jgi:hypothetical protein
MGIAIIDANGVTVMKIENKKTNEEIEQMKATIEEYERITNALLEYVYIQNEEFSLLEFLHVKSMAEPVKFNGDDYRGVLDWLQCQGG